MPTKEQRTNIYKSAIVFALIIIAGMLQNGETFALKIFNANALLLIPVVCFTGMCLGLNFGFAAGIFAGVLWDTVSSTPDGLLALYLGLIGLFSGFLVKRYMRNNMQTALLFSFLASVFLLGLRSLYFASFFKFEDTSVLFLKYFLPNLSLTFLISPLIYILLKKIYQSKMFLSSAEPKVYKL